MEDDGYSEDDEKSEGDEYDIDDPFDMESAEESTDARVAMGAAAAAAAAGVASSSHVPPNARFTFHSVNSLMREPTMVFCNTLPSCRAVEHYLAEQGFRTVPYHGGIPAKVLVLCFICALVTRALVQHRIMASAVTYRGGLLKLDRSFSPSCPWLHLSLRFALRTFSLSPRASSLFWCVLTSQRVV